MRRPRQALGFLVLCVGLLTPSTSFAQQSLNFSFGGFVPKGESSRADNDVLVNNLCCLDNPLLFDVGDFDGGTFGAELARAAVPDGEAVLVPALPGAP